MTSSQEALLNWPQELLKDTTRREVKEKNISLTLKLYTLCWAISLCCLYVFICGIKPTFFELLCKKVKCKFQCIYEYGARKLVQTTTERPLYKSSAYMYNSSFKRWRELSPFDLGIIIIY